MSKRSTHKGKSDDKNSQAKGPALVEIVGLGAGGLLFYTGAELLLLSNPHPLHWLAAVFGGVLGFIGGHVWYLNRGDIV